MHLMALNCPMHYLQRVSGRGFASSIHQLLRLMNGLQRKAFGFP
jgi:hypothetical protein